MPKNRRGSDLRPPGRLGAEAPQAPRPLHSHTSIPGKMVLGSGEASGPFLL